MIRTGLTVSLIGLVVIAAISAYGYISLPDGEQFARHWDMQGNPDGYSSKLEILLMTPLMALGLTVILAVLPNLLPRRDNLESSQSFYLVGWAGAIALLTGVHAMIVWSAISQSQPNIAFILTAVGLFITVFGNFMAKSKSNWIAGLRNPWTLTSEHAWAAGNRFCGYVFVLTGVGLIAATFLASSKIVVAVMLGGMLVAVIGGSIISYVAWRNDPERAL